MERGKKVWAVSLVFECVVCLLFTGCDALMPTPSASPNPGTGSNPTPTPSSSPAPSLAPSIAPSASPTISYAYDSKFGAAGAGNGQFNRPYGIAIDASNYLYVVDSSNRRVQKFTSAGVYQIQWATLLAGETSVSQPTDIDIGTVGSSTGVFVLDAGTLKLKAFFTTGGAAGSIDGSGASVGFVSPAGLCATGSNYYVTDASRDCVQVFSLAGSLTATYSCNVAGGGATQAANGVAVIPGEAIFVADEMGRVKKFGTTGAFISFIGSQGTGAGQMQAPIDVALDSANNLFVLDAANDKVVIFTKNGGYLGEFGSSGSGDGQLSAALGIAIDKDDDAVYISDTGNNRVQKFVKLP